MPLQKLQFKPGVNRDQTNYTGEGGFYECDKIRFRSGYPQKIGGWLQSTVETFLGVCRQMFNWVTSYNDNFLALGTNLKVYIEVGGNFYNITPIRQTFTTPVTSNCVSTNNTSAVVNFEIVGHGGSTGDYVQISGVATIGGIAGSAINGNRQITVVNSSNFTVVADTAATSTVINGGGAAITVAFEIAAGNTGTTFGYGWGTSTWSRGTWGSGSTSPIALEQRDWWFDKFDNDLLMNIRNGPIYIWERGVLTSPSTALAVRAVLLSSIVGATDVPAEAMQILISQNDRHLLAFGATPYGGGDFDPLLIRWANQDEPKNWTPAVTNSAGFLRVSRGSYIVCAVAMRQEILVWTDGTLSSLQFLGTADVFSLQELADNITIAGPRAVTNVNNNAYWMGKDKFYVYSGRVSTLPCTLRNHVFENINFNQADQIISGSNEGWNEVWWFYPSANSNTINKYVIYNHLEQIWYYGDIERTAWLDTPLRQFPQAVDSNGILYNHEQGVNDNASPMVSYITTNDFDLMDGEQLVLTKRIIPDVDFAGSTAAAPVVYMTLKPRNFPGANYTTEPEKSVTQSTTVPISQYTNQVFLRVRARQMGVKIMSDGLDTQWQLGSPRLDGKPDGRR
jgi:hypothetical protein